MRFLLIFLANRAMFLVVLMLVLNAYLQMSGLGRDASLPGQIDMVAQNFRVLADAFR